MAKKNKDGECAGKPACVIGIDPGLDGGIAFMRWNTPEETRVFKIPTWERLISRSRRRFFDSEEFSDLLKGYSGYGFKDAILENVHASSQMGVSSSFSFGSTFGAIQGCLVSCGYKVHLVEPTVWKRKMGVAGSDKKRSIAKAKEHFPFVEFGQHDGIAEALLLALYGLTAGDLKEQYQLEVDPLS